MDARTPLCHSGRTKPSRDEDSGRRTPDLPPELHALILNELDGEKATLKQCSLICKLYRHLAQKLLLKSVVFRFSNLANPADSFLEILEASPQIAHYVKRLSIRECGNLVHGTNRTQTQLEKSIPLVIPALINVVDLVIGWESFDFHFSHWKPSSQLSIMSTCANLLSLTLVHIDKVPLQIFDHLVRLENFILNDVSFIDDPDVQAAQISSPCQIKLMKLTDAWLSKTVTIYPFLRKRQFGVGHLESLSLDISERRWEALSPTDFEAAKWLISSNLGSLKVLDVTISENVPVILPNDEPVFDLSEMPLLQEWSLGGVVCSDELDVDIGLIGLGWLARHLETIPVGKRYKSVTLRPTILGADGVMDDYLDVGGLKYLESLIVDKVLPATDFFSITFMIWDSYATRPAKEQMRKHLPTLESLGLLHFEEN
ncbi:hypothetical protein CPC08DRAFT_713146 [Agrocybe pediades]|nr:hypothetical protein CPC08DRAFT_713146 [Agrocybe pediades]